MSGSGKCWPDIKRRFRPSNNKDFGAQVRLPLNLPATTWRFYAVVNVEFKGGWEEEGERSDYSTFTTSWYLRCSSSPLTSVFNTP